MDNTKYIALSRQMGLWKQMEIVSNNMANMNTSGFKAQDAMFSSYIAQTTNAEGIGKAPVYFTQDFAAYKDFSEGMMSETGNAFDLAISGDAFFAIDTADGEKYTRKGQFHLDANGMLVDHNSNPILSEGGTPFFFAPGEKEIVIAEDGEISTENGTIGRVKLIKFEDNQKLLKIGDTMFENIDGNQIMAANGDAKIHQGVVEKSNVNSINEMTKLINVQRSYEFVQQMIDTEHQRISNTIQAFAQMA